MGIDPPESVSPRKGLENGERLRGYGVWKGDLYGVGEILKEKRVGRGWREESVGELLESLEGAEMELVKGLLEWKGGEDGKERYGGELPWGSIKKSE